MTSPPSRRACRRARMLGLVAIAAGVALPGCEPAREASDREPPGREEAARATAGPAAPVFTAARSPCRVAAVTDGDSFRCRDGTRVRLLLLDAPEMSQAPYGAQARDALRRRLRRGDTAWLAFDVQREDRYGRTLAHVYTAASGGSHVNLAQASDGWATVVVYPPNVRHVDAIRAAVAEARRARRGLWGNGGLACPPVAHKRGDC